MALAGATAAQEVKPGLYQVTVEIEIPHIDTRDYTQTRDVCVSAGGKGLGPMGPGPLPACPSQTRRNGAVIEVTTRCTGPNTGWADALYRPRPGGFKGSVAMNMGGKNMTLIERQTGIWIGPCK